MIKYSARCCYHNVRLLGQRYLLWRKVHASNNGAYSQGYYCTEGLKCLANLERQFTSRRENEGKEWLWFIEEGLQDGQCKGCRLSGASFCEANDVFSLQRNRYRLGLDLSWSFVLEGCACFG